MSRSRTSRAAARVLVTGGAGFIGSHTVEALLAQGYQVRVLDDLSTGKAANLPLHDAALELRVGSVLDRDEVDAAMRGAQACIHLAAQVSAALSVEAPAASAERNVLGFINVLEALRAAGLPRLVYASSAAIYGTPQQLPLAEDAPTCPNNPYGLEKYVDELYADLYRRLHGLRSLGLRYFNVYGPRQDPSSPYSGVISRFVERLGAGAAPTVFGDGHQTRDFINVRDVAQANLAALRSDYCGVCNVATGRRSELLEMLNILGDCFGIEARPQFAPVRSGDVRDSLGDDRRMRCQLGVVASRGLEEGLAELVDSLAAPPPAGAPRAAPALRPI